MNIDVWKVIAFFIAFLVALIAAVAYRDRAFIAERAKRESDTLVDQQQARLRVVQGYIFDKLQKTVDQACFEHGHPNKAQLSNGMTADLYYRPLDAEFTDYGDVNFIKIMLSRRGEPDEEILMTIAVNLLQQQPVTINGEPFALYTTNSTDDVEDYIWDFVSNFSFASHFESKLLDDEGEDVLGPLDDQFITVS